MILLYYAITILSYDYDDMGESFTCSHEIGITSTSLFPEVINAIGFPSHPLQISRGASGDVEVYTTPYSDSMFIISDSDPKFGFKSGTCNINTGGYWTGTLTLKFLAESNF